MLIHMNTWTVWRFNEEKLPDKIRFYSSVKDGITGDNGEN